MNEWPAPDPHALQYAERDAACYGIQTILVVVDPTRREHPCIEKAARIAAGFGCTIELFVCEAEQDIPESWAGGATTAQYRGVMRERRIAGLEELAGPVRARGVSATTASEWHPALEEAVARHAIQMKADLVVKDAQRRAPMAPMPLLSDGILIREVAAPLLLVRPEPWPARPRVTISVDPSRVADRPLALDAAMVAMGCSIGRALAADVEILHALQSPPHLAGETVPDSAKEEVQARDRAMIEHLARSHHVSAAAVRYIERRVPEGILDLIATEKPDILVMGAVARPRFIQSTASGTAAQILEHVSCDMLIVKPRGVVSPILVTDA